LYEAHPHIGTNKLPQIITAMRQLITDCGAEFLFEKKVTDFLTEHDQIKAVATADGNIFEADDFILATGHSARDIFKLLHSKKILIEPKPFALGVRVEHPQQLIDTAQYHSGNRDIHLPPASYSLVQQVNERGVFSFCMCPGGIIAPAATAPGQIVVNGWSPSKRNNPYANSGMVVQVSEEDAGYSILDKTSSIKNPLLFLKFQQMVEENCFTAGGGKMVAPAQRMVDFSQGKLSPTLPACSYLPGLHSVELGKILPDFIYTALAKAFVQFGKKMPGYFTNDAVVVATESRTSSPVRIPRNNDTLLHPQFANLYPCGEGAGYAGGIVSAAMDGERIAEAIRLKRFKV
ncbi:MAG: FAD-dependent protein, partial [Ferruginibacter sp.]